MGAQPHMYEVNYLAGKNCKIKQVSKKALQPSVRLASEEGCDHHVNGVKHMREQNILEKRGKTGGDGDREDGGWSSCVDNGWKVAAGSGYHPALSPRWDPSLTRTHAHMHQPLTNTLSRLFSHISSQWKQPINAQRPSGAAHNMRKAKRNRERCRKKRYLAQFCSLTKTVTERNTE